MAASLSLQLLLMALFVIVCILPFTSTAPQAWRPQGRFGKRAAWRPQSRFGKRPSSSAFLSGRDGGPKRAWRPSSRFGKRDDDNFDTEASFEGRFEDIGALKRAWKPQGRFGKRMDEEMDLLETNSEEKRAWKPQGRFGKRLLRTQRWRNVIEALKRAWKPQGRFGKRADLSAEDEEQDDMNALTMDDVFVDQETGQPCIRGTTEDGETFIRCFQDSEADGLDGLDDETDDDTQ